MKILPLQERGYAGTRVRGNRKTKYDTRVILVLRAFRSVGLEVRKYVIIRGGDDMALTRNPVLFLRPFLFTGNRSEIWSSRRS